MKTTIDTDRVITLMAEDSDDDFAIGRLSVLLKDSRPDTNYDGGYRGKKLSIALTDLVRFVLNLKGQ